MNGMIVHCILDIWTLACCGTSACVLLARFFGYEKRSNCIPFSSAFALILCANTASDILVRGTETSWLVTELLLMVCAMGLPYLLLRPRKKMTFFWFGLTLCSVADYLEYVIVSFSRGMTRSGERMTLLTVHCRRRHGQGIPSRVGLCLPAAEHKSRKTAKLQLPKTTHSMRCGTKLVQPSLHAQKRYSRFHRKATHITEIFRFSSAIVRNSMRQYRTCITRPVRFTVN